MTPTQPAMGSFSGQNIVSAENMGHLTPGTAPAAANAEMANSDLTSQKQISYLPQTDGILADDIESKSGEDVSHGKVSSSAKGRLL